MLVVGKVFSFLIQCLKQSELLLGADFTISGFIFVQINKVNIIFVCLVCTRVIVPLYHKCKKVHNTCGFCTAFFVFVKDKRERERESKQWICK